MSRPTIATAQEHTTIEVRAGDTCRSIAMRALGDDPGAVARLHALNPELGPTPHRLVPGTTLRVPVRAPPARLSAVHRRVERRAPDAPSFASARRGEPLPRGTQVRTHEASSAEITFVDDRRVTVRERTLVIVHGGARRLTQRSVTRAELERGALRSRLGELAGSAPLEIETPSSRASLDGAAVVSVEDDGTSRVANHGRREATVIAGGERVRLPADTGTVVARGGRPSAPRRLLPAPRWQADRAGAVIGFVGRGASVSGGFEPVRGAARYRVEVARSPDGGELLRTIEIAGDARRFDADGLEEGTVYVSVSSIDAAGLEGRRSPWRAFGVRLARLVAPGGGAAPLEPAIPQVWPGTWLVAPRGLECGVAADARAALARDTSGAPREERDDRAAARDATEDRAPAVGGAPREERGDRAVARAGTEDRAPNVSVADTARDATEDRAPVEIGDAAPLATSAILTLRDPGQHEIVCRDRGGNETGPLVVDVLAPRPTVEGTPIRDRTVTMRLRFARTPPSRAIVVEAAGARVTNVRDEAEAVAFELQTPPDAPPVVELATAVSAGTERVPLATLRVPVRDPAGTRAATPAAEDPALPPPRPVQSAFGDLMWPAGLALRDERRGGIGAWIALAPIEAGPEPQLRVGVGARAQLPEVPLRFGFATQLDLLARPAPPDRRGDADLVASVGALLLDEGAFGAALELAAWFPTRGEPESLGRVRLVPSVEASWRPAPWLALRTRQGAIVDATGDGARLWSGALGVDAMPIEHLALGLEAGAAAGAFADREGAAVHLGGGVELRWSLLEIAAAARFALTDEARALFGEWSAILSVRVFSR